MRFTSTGVLIVSVITTVSCGDHTSIVQPKSNPFLLPSFTVVADPTSQTITLGQVDTAYGTASGTTNAQVSPYIRIVRVNGTSSISIIKRIPEAANPVPNPLEPRHGMGVGISQPSGSRSVNFPNVDGEAKMYITLASGEAIWMAYAGGGTQPNQSGTRADGTPWQCGPSVNNYCYLYSGSGGSVSITPLSGGLRLSVDSSKVSIGSTVRFTISTDTVETYPLPLQVDSVNWVPAAEADSGESTEAKKYTACVFSGNSCTKTILGTGNLEVIAHVNGYRKVKTQRVSVREGALTLTAVPASVTTGGNVSFTARWSDGTSVSPWKWNWLPDSGASTVQACPSNVASCTKPVNQSGKMVITAVRNGVFRTARAHVNVVPCLTGDNALDDPDVRRDFAAMMRLSNPDSAPGSGISSTNWLNTGWRKERALWIVRRADGNYETVTARLMSATECSFQPDWTQYDEIRSTLAPGDSIVALAHTHPGKPGDSVFGQCSYVDQVTQDTIHAQRFPGDTAVGYGPARAGADSTNGGGSDYDWAIAHLGQVDVYTMNRTTDLDDPSAEGQVWKLPKSTFAGDYPKFDDIAGRRKHWKNSCGWS